MRKFFTLGFTAILAACVASPQDQAAWNDARAANSVTAYRAYLTAFPDGFYAKNALARLETVLSPSEIEELELATGTSSDNTSGPY